MKSLLELTVVLLQECSSQCSVDPAADIDLLQRRVTREGDSFLTITLPAFCQAFERGLERGYLEQTDFSGFTRIGRSGPPQFLGGFLSLVFDTEGKLRTEVDPDVIYLVRQICLLHKKSWAIANERRQTAAIRGYLSAEDETAEEFDDPGGYFRSVAAVVIQDIVRLAGPFDPSTLIGRHGPGATVEQFTTNKKWLFSVWHDRLEEQFCYSDHAVPNYGCMLEPEVQDRVTLVPENEESPVKVIFVPKTMKTPRVIAIEPACMQYAQQAVAGYLIPAIEGKTGRGRRHGLTQGRVNFSDQTINQRLALEASGSSWTGNRLATLDMKEASDRVSYAHAKALFAVYPRLWDAIDSCRSRRARLPDGTVIPLKKFASMGSAMCFPTEALAFFVAIVASRLRERNLPVTHSTVEKWSRDVYVYGDDILVPAVEAELICTSLDAFGFRVNRHKSFWNGKFRESCGVDAYDGVLVTPVYCRYGVPGQTEVEALVSWVAMANGLYDRGLWRTAAAVRAHVEGILGALPVHPRDIGGLRWTTVQRSFSVGRWNRKLHRFEARSYVPAPAVRPDALQGYAALHKCLQQMEQRSPISEPLTAVDHLASSVRRGSLALKGRWLPV